MRGAGHHIAEGRASHLPGPVQRGKVSACARGMRRSIDQEVHRHELSPTLRHTASARRDPRKRWGEFLDLFAVGDEGGTPLFDHPRIRTVPGRDARSGLQRTYHYWHAFVPGVKGGGPLRVADHGAYDPRGATASILPKPSLDPYGKEWSFRAATTGSPRRSSAKRPCR